MHPTPTTTPATTPQRQPPPRLPLNPMHSTQALINSLKTEAAQTSAATYQLLKVESANAALHRAATQPVPNMLFSQCWFEQEICFLFADTGLGKSILAVQIADAITRGQALPGFRMEAQAQPVLYLDFELSDKQFQSRYSNNYQNNYPFSPHLYRLQVDRDKIDIPDDIETSLKTDIETAVLDKGAKIIIVDNITWVKTETEKAKDALPLMKYLKGLQRTHNLSILILAHTPKIAESTPITQNDMAGSKHLMNFVDSAFALGQSHKNGRLRYLKQIKVRACEAIFTTQNVVTLQIEKQNNFTGFHVLDYGKEYDHLKPLKEVENEIRAQKIIELKRSNPALSNRQIAREVGTNAMKVTRVLNSLEPQQNTKPYETDGEPF